MKKRVKNEVKCTGGGARTPTPLREMDFESIASADSATPAILKGRVPSNNINGASEGARYSRILR